MRQNSFTRLIIPVLLVSTFSLLGGWGIAHYSADFRYLLFLALLIAMAIVVALGKKALQIGFVLWIWMFLLGYRTIYITSYFKLHPLIVFLALLFLILLFALKSESKIKIKLTSFIMVVQHFLAMGFCPGCVPWHSMDQHDR